MKRNEINSIPPTLTGWTAQDVSTMLHAMARVDQICREQFMLRMQREAASASAVVEGAGVGQVNEQVKQGTPA